MPASATYMEYMFCLASVTDLNSMNPYPDPDFLLNANPGSGFYEEKIEQIYA